ncbi:MAG: carbonic anhydrase family protein [Caulobacterales bacterium]|nr:carbonic anhydrase family protein [Caulobacterales bacterium]
MSRVRTLGRRVWAGAILAAGTACAVAAAVWAESDGVSWSYAGEGGPEHWGALDPEYAVCSEGHQQSPIDLSAATPAEIAPPRLIWAPPAAAEVVNNGHTIQVNLEGAGGLAIGDRSYELLQFHFHHRSEHTVSGKSFPLEAHFVHAAEDGELAVIGVFFQEGEANPALEPIWEAASAEPGPPTALGAQIDPRELLPEGKRAFHYAGSLTTPPCSEIVIWTVYAQPVTASAQQIEDFGYVFPNNARPVQPRNRRFVLQSGG